MWCFLNKTNGSNISRMETSHMINKVSVLNAAAVQTVDLM